MIIFIKFRQNLELVIFLSGLILVFVVPTKVIKLLDGLPKGSLLTDRADYEGRTVTLKLNHHQV